MRVDLVKGRLQVKSMHSEFVTFW